MININLVVSVQACVQVHPDCGSYGRQRDEKNFLISFVVIASAGLAVCFINLSALKDAFITSVLAKLYVEKFRDGRVIDENHLVTKLDNGMEIVVNKHDRCVCWFTRLTGHWDSNESAAVKYLVKPGFSIIEVGANFGVYTLPMASLVGPQGKVYAFEANPHVSKYLKQSISLNSLENIVTLYEKAAGDENGIAYISFGLQNIGGGYLVKDDNNHATKTDIVRLDDVLGDKKIDILKIDTEGCEEKIISNSKKIIESNPDIIIMIEWSPKQLVDQGSKPSDLLDLLKSYGFRAWKIVQKNGDKPNFIEVSFEEILKIPYCDLVFSRKDYL